MDGGQLVEALKRCALFAHVDETGLGRLARALRPRRFRRGEVIFHEGDPGESLHIVASGAIKIAVGSAEGGEAILAVLREGDFFGELALLDGAPRSATASAIDVSETLVLPRGVFRELLSDDARLRDALLAGLAHELRRLTSHVAELHFLDLPGRLAMRIVRLAEQDRPGQELDVTLDWPLTQSDLASMIGGTRQSVNRALSDLVAHRAIRIERDRLTIPDVGALRALADR